MGLTFNQLENDPFINDPDVLTNLFPPRNRFLHRDSQLDQITMNLSPILRNKRAKNFFVYGLRGSGKTASVLFKARELKNICNDKKIKFNYLYTNCGERGFNNDINVCIDLIEQLDKKLNLPKTGLTRGHVYDMFIKIVTNGEYKNILIILDEIDALLKGSSKDELLFFLSRTKDNPKFEGINISTIIISNESIVKDVLKLRTESSFGRDRVDFLSYNATELLDILKDRVKLAFKKGVIGDGVLERISGDESQKYGDARRVLEILWKCYNLALTKNMKKITLDVVNPAITLLDEDIYFVRIRRLTLHQKYLLLAILCLEQSEKSYSQNIYSYYSKLTLKAGRQPLDIRSIRNFFDTLEEANIIETSVYYEKKLSKKTKHIVVLLRAETKKKSYDFLSEQLGIEVPEYKAIKIQKTL